MYHVDGRSMRSVGRFGVLTSVRLLAWKTDSRGQCRAIWTWVSAERAEACSVAGRKNWPDLCVSRGTPAADYWRSVVDGELSGAGVRKAAFAVFSRFPECASVRPVGTRVWVAAERICLWRVSVSFR